MSLEATGSGSPESSSSSSSSESSSSISTSDVAAQVISSFESGEGNDEPIAQSEAAPAAKADETDPDDYDAQPAETTDALGRKRPNKIPHDRVGKMLTKREQKVLSSVAKELGLTPAEGAALKLEDIVGSITANKTKYQEYDTRFESYQSVEKIMEAEPERFVRMLAQVESARAAESGQPNPGKYQRIVDFLDGKHAPAAAAAAQVDDDPEPEPDYDLGNGSRTYSLDGMRKRDEWRDRQTEKRLAAKLDERLSPYEKERKQREEAEQKRQQFAQINEAASKKIDAMLTKAKTWVGFTENEQAIQDLVIEKGMELHEAYMNVVLPKFQTDRNKMRGELLDEINKTPKSTSVATNPAAAKASQGDKPISSRDIAAEEIAKAMGR